MKNYLLGLLLLITSISYAQDNDRMKRDIEVAKNILSTLINQESNVLGRNVEGIYIQGHGAMFTIYGGVFSNLTLDRAILLPPGPGDDGIYRLGKTTSKPINLDSLNNAIRAQTKEVMTTFITDYAQLLSQLKSDEKVLLRYTLRGKYQSFGLRAFSDIATTDATEEDQKRKEKEEKMLKEFSAEISKVALDEYRSGKLNKSQLESQIKFSEQVTSNKKDTELELLGSIFHRLYQGDLSETFRLYSDPNYERIAGLGVVFEMNFGNHWGQWGRAALAYSYAWDGYTLGSPRASTGRGQDKKKSDEDEDKDEEKEWKEKLKTIYPKFIEEFKQHVIEYGRTVRKLPSNELLIFKLDLNACEDCGIPDQVEISIKKSVLESYDSNKMTMEQALGQITMIAIPGKK